jgi:hypothetical protein
MNHPVAQGLIDLAEGPANTKKLSPSEAFKRKQNEEELAQERE